MINLEQQGLIVTEGIEGYWHYHLSPIEKCYESLCGQRTITCGLPFDAWGTVTHLKERYCDKCIEQAAPPEDEEEEG